MGYELKRIFLGSQKNLGISTECIMQIRKKPENSKAVKIKIKLDNIFGFLSKLNKKSLRPTLVYLSKNEESTISAHFLLDGATKIVNTQVEIIKSISENPSVDISSEEFFKQFYNNSENPKSYIVPISKIDKLLTIFNVFEKIFVIDENTILITFNSDKLPTSESEINKNILELNGKKANIHPLNKEELELFGDKKTAEIIQKIISSFNSKRSNHKKELEGGMKK